MNCIICGKNEFKLKGKPIYEPKLKESLADKNFKVVSCRNCGLVQLIPDANEILEQIKNFYEGNYFSENLTEWWENKRSQDRNERLKYLNRFTSAKITRFLDIGCGTGDVLNTAAGAFSSVHGQDIFDNVDATKLKIPKSNIFIGMLDDAGYKDNEFEGIYLDSVLEHVVNPVEFLMEIKRILSPGGCLYIGVPNEYSVDGFFKKLIFKCLYPGVSSVIDPFRNPYHVIGFSKKSLRVLCGKCGLKIIYLQTIGGTYEFRKHSVKSFAFWKTLIFWPFYVIGVLFNNAFYIEAYIQKFEAGF